MCTTRDQVPFHGKAKLGDVTAGMTDAEQAAYWRASRDRMAAQAMEQGTVIDGLRQREEAAREFVKRHPKLTLIDLAEFEAFLKIPAALQRAGA